MSESPYRLATEADQKQFDKICEQNRDADIEGLIHEISLLQWLVGKAASQPNPDSGLIISGVAGISKIRTQLEKARVRNSTLLSVEAAKEIELALMKAFALAVDRLNLDDDAKAEFITQVAEEFDSIISSAKNSRKFIRRHAYDLGARTNDRLGLPEPN